MQVQGINTAVFPLRSLDTFMDGYYADITGAIWSTKGRIPVRLHGSRTPSGQRYFTLNKRSYNGHDIMKRAKAHPMYNSEINTPLGASVIKQIAAAGLIPAATPKATPVAPVPTIAGRTLSARAAAVSKGYLLATLSPDDKLVFGSNPVFHLSSATAKAEAERLAITNGSEVVVLAIMSRVKASKVVWE